MEKYVVLLVDDEVDLLETIKENLELNEKFRVYVAKSGSEAYSKAFNLNLDIIITDFRMPVMTGSQLIDVLHASPKFSSVPMIILTGSMAEARAAIKETSLIAFMEKPAPTEDLEKTILGLIEKRDNISAAKQDLDVEILNAFIQATEHTLKAMTLIDRCQPGKTTLKKADQGPRADASGVIQLSSSSFNGAFILSFPANTIKKIATALLGTEFKDLNVEVAEVAGELLNIIWGQTKGRMQEKKVDFKSGLPTVIWGENSSKIHLGTGPTLTVPFQSDLGDFWVDFFLKSTIQKLKV